MKERPIIFSAEMVRALLDGRKSMMRWIVRFHSSSGYIVERGGKRRWHRDDPNAVQACPFGALGDRLWVRECFGEMDGQFHYRADAHNAILPPKWKPSIHMPRHASRILIEITNVRVERLQNITEEDAIAEGAFFTDYGKRCFHGWQGPGECPAPEAHHQQRPGWSMIPASRSGNCLETARRAFANFWVRMNGYGSWEENPWVWVIEFRRAK